MSLAAVSFGLLNSVWLCEGVEACACAALSGRLCLRTCLLVPTCTCVFVCGSPSSKPTPVRPVVHDSFLIEPCLPTIPEEGRPPYMRGVKTEAVLETGLSGAWQTASVSGAEAPRYGSQGG